MTGMDFDILTNGDYKLLLEPIAYFNLLGVDIALTATEAALYDESSGGVPRVWMWPLSHKNLPLAMFLKTPGLGYPAWSGSRYSEASNADIKSSLGLGIIRFTDEPEGLVLDTFDYEYRTDTEVITSVWVSGGQSDPNSPTTVTFRIDGADYTVSNVYYPSGDSQLVWVKWTTPPEPCEMTISVSASGTGTPAQGSIHVKVVDLDENPPPNPVADDRNDSFTRSSVPNREQTASSSWGVWRPWWRAFWVWHGDDDDDGYWCDHAAGGNLTSTATAHA